MQLLGLLAYMLAGAAVGIFLCEEEDSAGDVFVYTFLWPLPVGIMVLGMIWDGIAALIDSLMDRPEQH